MSKSGKGDSKRPKYVVKKYAPIFGGEANVRQIIFLALQDGSIRCRAAHQWMSDEPDLMRAWKDEPDSDRYPIPRPWKSIHDVRRSKWRRSITPHDDLLLWDFRGDRLHLTIGSDPIRRIMLRGVRFNYEDVEKVFKALVPYVDDKTFTRSNKLTPWRRFWHEIVIMAAQRSGKLPSSPLGQAKSDEEILDLIKTRLKFEFRFSEEDDQNDANDLDLTADIIADRLNFGLSKSAIIEEIKFLRQTLDLKRTYLRRKQRAVMQPDEPIGSAGSLR